MINSLVTNDSYTTEKKLINQRIEKGLDYLYDSQLPNGGFPVYISFKRDMNPHTYLGGPIIWDAALILRTLNLIDNTTENKHNKKINEMKTKVINFLLNNKEQHGVWRVFGKEKQFIPPDIDDTSVAFAGLVESGVVISDETLDYMTNYKNSEGIFYTWMDSEWFNTVDHNININALYAYSLRNRNKNEVIRYLKNIIENKLFINGSTYYPSPYVFIYLIAKTYSDGKVKELKPYLNSIKEYLLKTQNSDGGWGNDIDTAMATTSLINLDYKGESIKTAIRHILNSQDKNGSWDIYSIYILLEFSLSNTIYPTIYFGSQETTTSFSLEGLIKYQKSIK